MRLTDIAIKAIQAPPKGAKIHHCDTLAGFGVRVTSTGVKSFVLTYGANRERQTLGRYPVISLAEARQIAREKLAERTLGKHRPARLKMSEALLRFYQEKEAKNKTSTLKITRGILNTHFKHLHGKNLEDIKPEDIAGTTDKLIASGFPSAANHALTAIRTFLKWSARRGHIHHSPAENSERPAKLNTRERVLSDEELRAIWKATDTCGTFGNIVKLLILTGQRRSEIGSLRVDWCSLPQPQCNWETLPPSQFSGRGENTDCEVMQRLDGSGILPEGNLGSDERKPQHQCTITFPPTITKNKRSHTFPIGKIAASVIAAALTDASTPLIFPARASKNTSFNGFSKSKVALDKKISDQFSQATNMVPWTLHDLRRTYATNLQRLGVKLEVIEQLLNHISGSRSGVTGIYQRFQFTEECREAVNKHEAWFAKAIVAA